MILRCSITTKIPEWTYPTGSKINFHGSQIILNSFPHRRRISVNSAGDLIIQNLQQTDAGQYTCSYPGSGKEIVSLAVPGMYARLNEFVSAKFQNFRV